MYIHSKLPMKIIRIVKKFGNSGHIIVKKELIGKEVNVYTNGENVYTNTPNVYTEKKNVYTNKENVYTNGENVYTPDKAIRGEGDTPSIEIDESERDFLNQYIISDEHKKVMLKDRAIKQFGSNRVDILLSSIKKN